MVMVVMVMFLLRKYGLHWVARLQRLPVCTLRPGAFVALSRSGSFQQGQYNHTPMRRQLIFLHDRYAIDSIEVAIPWCVMHGNEFG